MAFYDNLGKRIQQTGQGAIDRTKKGAEVARLNSSINGLAKDMSKQYEELGRAYYDKFAASGAYDPDMAVFFQELDAKMSQVEDCKDQIRSLKGYRKCPVCGEDISADAMYCPNCGTKQEPIVAESPAAGRVCPNCGAELEDDQIFCTVCGTNVENVVPNAAENEEPAQETPEAEEDVVVEENLCCPNCGAVLKEDEIFCSNCGQKIER